MKAIHDIENSRVILEDSSEVCFNTSYRNNGLIKTEVVDTVVNMINTGAMLTDIDDYLLDAPCLQDEREIIVEGLYFIYQKNI